MRAYEHDDMEIEEYSTGGRSMARVNLSSNKKITYSNEFFYLPSSILFVLKEER